LMAFFINPLWIFFARTIDRFGKGIRTGARDAILSSEATPATKGRVFGFHRSMDTLGAVLGPSLALVYLYYFPDDYRTLFLVAFFPGLLAIAASFLLKEKPSQQTNVKPRVKFFSFISYWKESPVAYKKLLVGLLVFTLFNSSDVFLLLKAKDAGLSDAAVIGVYIFYNLIYALFSYPIGILADRVGLKSILISGLIAFATVYFGMAFCSGMYVYLGLFFVYGVYAAATEGVSKAWISNIISKNDTATAIGTFAGLQSVCALIASSLTGLVWFVFGATTAFVLTAAVTLLVCIYLFVYVPKPSCS
ncbi:MAG TPA: MFS transporter, partial [Tenuifilaceae bacterium]|nr:MFS transporter [Tenuifilaceae bacterium]